MKGPFRLKKVYGYDGFILNWMLLGPFNEEGVKTSCEAISTDYLIDAGGEVNIEPHLGGTVCGKSIIVDETRHGFIVNLFKHFHDYRICVYGACYLVLDKGCDAEILLGSDDGYRLWANHQLVGECHQHRGCAIDNNIHKVKLNKGKNTILIKVENNFGAYEFCMRVRKADGSKLKGCRVYTDNPDNVRTVHITRQKTRQYSTLDYFNHIAYNIKPILTCKAKTPKDFKIWHKKFKKKLLELIGLYPQNKVSLSPEVLERVDMGDYMREKVVYNTEKTASVPAYVLIPKTKEQNKKFKAILCLHGHGNGKNDVVGIHNNDPARIEAIKTSNTDYAIKLVKKGYLAITPDFRGFGYRNDGGSPFGPYRDKCDINFNRGLLMGINIISRQLWDLKRTIDYLTTRKDVEESSGFGCIGLSYGGTMTTYFSAVDERIKVVVISCALTSFTNLIINGGFCGSQMVPGLYKWGDFDDVVLLSAPKPVFIESGKFDSGFSIVYAAKSHTKIRNIYKMLGIEERLEIEVFDGEHRFDGRRALDWFDRCL